jgi:hypothetical protein
MGFVEGDHARQLRFHTAATQLYPRVLHVFWKRIPKEAAQRGLAREEVGTARAIEK